MPVAVTAAIGEIVAAIANPRWRRQLVSLEQKVCAAQIGPELAHLPRILLGRGQLDEAERQRQHRNIGLSAFQGRTHGGINLLDILILDREATY